MSMTSATFRMDSMLKDELRELLDNLMLTIKYQTAFKKDFQRIKKRGYDIRLLENVIENLTSGVKLDERYRDHALSGDWGGFRECHIAPDWLLIYQIDGNELILFLTRTGTHADLLGM